MKAGAPPKFLRRFFSGLAEQTFVTRLGLADPSLIDYLAELLTRFTRTEMIYRVRNVRGRPLMEVAEMMIEAQQRIGDARREVHRHVGDVTLFYSGVYPEALPQLQRPSQKDHLLDLCATGKQAYRIASQMRTDENADECDVLQRLSEEFDVCASGLREVRRQWEKQAPAGEGLSGLLLN